MISKGELDLEQLLELDEVRIDVGGGFWVALRAKRVPQTVAKPHGIDYSLCLIGPDEIRLVCYDNAHVVREGKRRGVAGNDHRLSWDGPAIPIFGRRKLVGGFLDRRPSRSEG
jgi:hypothetical protein